MSVPAAPVRLAVRELRIVTLPNCLSKPVHAVNKMVMEWEGGGTRLHQTMRVGVVVDWAFFSGIPD